MTSYLKTGLQWLSYGADIIIGKTTDLIRKMDSWECHNIFDTDNADFKQKNDSSQFLVDYAENSLEICSLNVGHPNFMSHITFDTLTIEIFSPDKSSGDERNTPVSKANLSFELIGSPENHQMYGSEVSTIPKDIYDYNLFLWNIFNKRVYGVEL